MEPDSGMTMYGPLTSTLRQYVLRRESARRHTRDAFLKPFLAQDPAERHKSLRGFGLEQQKLRSSDTACCKYSLRH